MTFSSEKREHDRLEHKEPVELSYLDSNAYQRAVLINYCEDGMCIESGSSFQPGEKVHVRVVQSRSVLPFFESDDVVNAAVRFCRKKKGADSDLHKIGVQLLRPISFRKNNERFQDLRRRAENFLDKKT